MLFGRFVDVPAAAEYGADQGIGETAQRENLQPASENAAQSLRLNDAFEIKIALLFGDLIPLGPFLLTAGESRGEADCGHEQLAQVLAFPAVPWGRFNSRGEFIGGVFGRFPQSSA